MFLRCLIIAVPLLVIGYYADAQYRLQLLPVDKDSAFIHSTLRLQTSFKSSHECEVYINQLPGLLTAKGYPAASIDSVGYGKDTAAAVVYFGNLYKTGRINTANVDRRLLVYAGWKEQDYNNNPLNLEQLQAMQQKMLDYLENNGYPFAKIKLDSLQLEGDQFFATLNITKGPLYKIDSIRVYGDANISPSFLQHYLDIPPDGIYQKDKLQAISKKIRELPYVQEQQPWNLTMLGTGAVVNVYLAPKKSSQINVLVGLLSPDNPLQTSKLRFVGEATINLRNALGNGESIGLNWQQLQVKSPRLDISFAQPYIFNMPFGVDGAFNLFKKDSSFVNLSLQLGVQYALSATQTGRVFIQSFTTNLLAVDTNTIHFNKILPVERDIRSVSLGIDYTYNNTDYRFNPRKGNEFYLVTSAGTRKVRKNNVIVQLHDPGFDFNSLYDTVQLNSYQFRIKGSLAHYFQLGRQNILKAGLNGGWLQSPDIYRNELFQIGGYRLLRGFDEQSIYVSQYAVGTVEYRYLIGRNSFFFSFVDAALTADKSVGRQVQNRFIGGGLGMAFETKAGVFNLSYAVGKQDDAKFNLRQAKIHIGYVSYF